MDVKMTAYLRTVSDAVAKHGWMIQGVAPAEGQTGSPPRPAGGGVDEERRRIEEALDLCAGNQTRAAEMLGISRFGLQKMMRRLGLDTRTVPK